jgi:hypothetical protein
MFKPSRERRGRGSLLVFLAAALIYVSCPVKGVSDLIWSIPTAFSLMREGNADLDEYRPSFALLGGAGVIEVEGHARNYFPMGPTLIVLGPLWVFNAAVDLVEPLARPVPKLAKGIANWQRDYARVGRIDLSFFVVTEMVLGSLVAALAASFIQRMAAERLPWRWALGVSAVFALCSPMWSTASRDLGQHGPSVLMLSIALWLLVRADRVPSSAAWAGPFVALSYVMRPTNSLAVVGLTLLVLLRHRRQLLPYLGLALLVALPFCLYNLSVYDSVFPPYYRAARILPASGALWLEALTGNLVSPARGLLIYSPVFLFSAYGLWLELRAGGARVRALVIAGIVVAHWIAVSSFPHWWGGHSNGPRFMTDMTPYLCYFLVPVVERVRATWAAPVHRRGLGLALAACAAFSLFTHLRSATSWDVYHWNGSPAALDVDRHPERLWDLRDVPFLRGLRAG